MTAVRLDQLLVQKGLCESREKAQRLILAGSVRVAGKPAGKPGHTYPDDALVEMDAPSPFVSRGGEKLEEAFRRFNLDVTGRICLDVGASTGGFTDCLLQHGAAKVFAVDVGRAQMHDRLRRDPRVVVMEGVNARYLDGALIPEKPTFCCIDVSFISLTLILPAVINVLATPARLVTLIKPQFEAGRDQVGKGGVVRDPEIREAVVKRICQFGVDQLGLVCEGTCPSPLLGPAGNVEFLASFQRP